MRVFEAWGTVCFWAGWCAVGGVSLECSPQFWPAMATAPRRYEALILVNGALVKLCFDPDADGSVQRLELASYVTSVGLTSDDAERDSTVELLVQVLFLNKMRRWNPSVASSEAGSGSERTVADRLRPDVTFELVAGVRDTAVAARMGEEAGAAAQRSCAAMLGPFLHSVEDCEHEAAGEIRRMRGFLASYDKQYLTANHRLTRAVSSARPNCQDPTAQLDDGAPSCTLTAEGGTYFYPFKVAAMRRILRQLLDADPSSVVHVCEVGFNMGHSSLLWLLESERVRVRAFDLGAWWYTAPALHHLESEFGTERIQVTFGDSSRTLRDFGAAFRMAEPPEACALVFVDGGHDFDVALSDIEHLRGAARPESDGGHILLVDDPNHDDVGRAWRDALRRGLITHDGDVFEDAHHATLYDARAAMVFGTYLPTPPPEPLVRVS